MESEENVHYKKNMKIFEFWTNESNPNDLLDVKYRDPLNESKITKITLPRSSKLVDLYYKIEIEDENIHDLRFYYQGKIVILEETLKNVLNMANSEDLVVVVNGSYTFITDYDNKAHKKGNEYFKASKYSEAILEYSKSISRYPTYYHSLSNRAKSYVKIENYVPALNDCKKLEMLCPKNDKKFRQTIIQIRKTASFYHGKKLLEKGDRLHAKEKLRYALAQCICQESPDDTFYEQTFNLLIRNKFEIDICLLCDKSTERMKKISFVPTKLVDDFPNYPLEYQIICNDCCRDQYENSFVENIWKVFYDEPNHDKKIEFSYKQGYLYWFSIITAWKSLILNDIKPDQWKHNDFALKKGLLNFKNLLLGNKEVAYPNSYIFVGKNEKSYEYNNRVVVEDKCTFTHVQIGNFHICTLIAGTHKDFNDFSRIFKCSHTFKVGEKLKRNIPSILQERQLTIEDLDTDDEEKNEKQPKKKSKFF